jgi:type IV secretion system pilin
MQRPSLPALPVPPMLAALAARVTRRRLPARHRRPAAWHALFTREFAATVAFVAVLLTVFGPQSGFAWAANSIPTVIDNTRNWIMGILTGLAVLFLTIGGVRYLMAGGDPGEIEKAKSAFKAAATGFALAVLAPVILAVLQGIVGDPGPATPNTPGTPPAPAAPQPPPPTVAIAMASGPTR